MEKITSLTEMQKERLSAFLDEWRGIVTATGEADVDAIRQDIDQEYRDNQENPPYIWHCESPLIAYLLVNILRLRPDIRDDLVENLRHNHRRNLKTNFRNSERKNIRKIFQATLKDDLEDQQRLILWDSLWHNFGEYQEVWLRDMFQDDKVNFRHDLDEVLRMNFEDDLILEIQNLIDQNLARNLGSPRTQIRDSSSRNNLETHLWMSHQGVILDHITENIRDQIWDVVWDNLESHLLKEFNENLRANLKHVLQARLGPQLELSFWKHFRGTYRGNIGNFSWGSLTSYWLTYYLFPQQYLRKMYSSEQMEKLNRYIHLARNCFCFFPFKEICFVCDGPTFIGMDDRNRIHADDRAAVEFSDGWKTYVVHGVQVPEYIIERPSEVTARMIYEQHNVEARRIMLDRFGWDRYLVESNTRPIQQDDCGILYRKEIDGDEPLVMVKVRNSTPDADGSFKHYLLRVPPWIHTAREAVAWTFDMQESEYAPSQEA